MVDLPLLRQFATLCTTCYVCILISHRKHLPVWIPEKRPGLSPHRGLRPLYRPGCCVSARRAPQIYFASSDGFAGPKEFCCRCITPGCTWKTNKITIQDHTLVGLFTFCVPHCIFIAKVSFYIQGQIDHSGQLKSSLNGPYITYNSPIKLLSPYIADYILTNPRSIPMLLSFGERPQFRSNWQCHFSGYIPIKQPWIHLGLTVVTPWSRRL